jgi:hypothetical protein
MRRWATWLLVGGLAALGAVAVADALRGSPKSESQAPTISVALIPRNEPAASAISGVLYYSSANDGCRLDGIRLPDLESTPAPEIRSCRFSMSPNGRTALPGDEAWSPDGQFFARQRGELLELVSTTSGGAARFPGHAPAFKPDGTFTYVRGNTVVECRSSELIPPCGKSVARFGGGPVLELAWLSNERMAVITKPSEWVLTIRERSLRTSTLGFGRPLTDLQVSPRGSFVAVRAEGRGGLLVLRPNGLAAGLPPFTNPRSITWSPDERWTAIATARSVFVFRTNASEARIRRLPIVARGLAWRA